MNKTIDIIYITYNRLDYTKKTLPVLIENAGIDFNLTIVDNGSTDGTVSYLKRFLYQNKKIVKNIVFLEKNYGISIPTNEFWKNSRSEFIGKVDNDTLCPPHWLQRLLYAHQNSDRLGVIGGFHFNPKYVDMSRLQKRVVNIDRIQIIPDAHIGGCCYLFRRSIQRSFGFIQQSQNNLNKKTTGWTEYQWKIFKKGYINGYIFPLLLVEHLDDPLNKNNLAFTKHKLNSLISLGEKGISMDRESLLKWYMKDVERVILGTSLKNYIL